MVRHTASLLEKGIDAGYGRIADAIRRKDIELLFALTQRTFGRSCQAARCGIAIGHSRNGLAQVRETHHISNTIIGLKACGNHGNVTVLHVWVRTQIMNGKLRPVDTHAVQDEQWFQTSAGWFRRKISNVINGLALVDGKRVDTNHTYDPEEPEYDPYDPHPKRPSSDTLLRIAIERGIGAASSAARVLRRSGDFYVTESQLNAVGYRLLGSKRPEDAIELFKLSVSLYPRSGNGYDSLGEAYLAHADTALALRSYRRALLLNPTNASTAEIIRRLR